MKTVSIFLAVVLFGSMCFILGSITERFKGQSAIIPLSDLEEFCDGLERLNEDIYLTWMREDGARVQLCIRGKDRKLYAFSLPSDESAEFIKVSDGKPMWYEDGSYSFAEEEN